MTNTNKILKDYYREKLLKRFNLLKLEDSMQEVLEYAEFIKKQEKQLKKLGSQTENPLNKTGCG